jgi:hypothetical protein
MQPAMVLFTPLLCTVVPDFDAPWQLVNGDVMRETFVHLQRQPSFFVSVLANLYQYLFVFLLMYVLLFTMVAINENAYFEARYVYEHAWPKSCSLVHKLGCFCLRGGAQAGAWIEPNLSGPHCGSFCPRFVMHCSDQVHNRRKLSPRLRALVRRL